MLVLLTTTLSKCMCSKIFFPTQGCNVFKPFKYQLLCSIAGGDIYIFFIKWYNTASSKAQYTITTRLIQLALLCNYSCVYRVRCYNYMLYTVLYVQLKILLLLYTAICICIDKLHKDNRSMIVLIKHRTIHCTLCTQFIRRGIGE